MIRGKNIGKYRIAFICTALLLAVCFSGCGNTKEDDVITLRVSNWEEYIDEGDWDEAVELDDGTEIIGENSIVDDFEDWYYETYGQRVKVEYSTYGTNEELYNQITIGDVYDLVCPSEYMIGKLLREGMLVPFSEDFCDEGIEENYYKKGVSPYIDSVFKNMYEGDDRVSDYAAGYMWGTMGIVYNPEEISKEDASHWDVILNKDYFRRVTIKDSVRDSFFPAIAIEYYDEITADDFVNSPDYHEKLSRVLNRTDEETIKGAEAILSRAKDNVYSFETDAGKADLVTGKVVANLQWSGDAVYTLDQAEEDEVELYYVIPEEVTNLWFDGWVMLKDGLSEDPRKQQAAEAFVNFLSRPDNAIRNMNYIGYTSVISGGGSDMMFNYLKYCYAAEGEDTVLYNDIGYFFEADTPEANEKYSVLTTPDQLERQLFTQYPPRSVMDRAVVMACFDDESNERINRAWTNIRCFDINKLFDYIYVP